MDVVGTGEGEEDEWFVRQLAILRVGWLQDAGAVGGGRVGPAEMARFALESSEGGELGFGRILYMAVGWGLWRFQKDDLGPAIWAKC